MKLPGKSAKQTGVDIKDYYAVKPASIWRGLKQESAAFWWLCIYLFFEYVRPQNIYKVIDVLPWAQVAILFAIVTAITDRDIKLVRSPANPLFISFTVIVLLSAIFAFNRSISFNKIDVPISWVIVYFLVITLVNTEKRFFVFVLLFILVNFKMSQFGFISWAQRGFGFAKWGLSGSPGWFQNAGDFALQMTIFAPLAIAFVLALRGYLGRYKKLFFYFLPFTALMTIIGSSSRGAQLGLMAVGLWFLYKSRTGIKAVAGILIVGWALYSVLPEEMLKEFDAAGEDRTSEQRLVLWAYSLEVVADHPFLGVGPENWVHYCWYMNPVGVFSGGIDEYIGCLETHNTYLEAATETGVTGFVLLIMIMLVIFLLNARTRANAKKINNQFLWYMAHGLDGGLVGCMVSSIFLSILFYPMIWVQLAMTVALNNISNKQLGNSKNTLHKT